MLKTLFSSFKNKIPFYIFATGALLLIFYVPTMFFYIDQNAIIGESIRNDRNLVTKDYDVLLMGDSRCHQGCDPYQITKHIQESGSPEVKVYNLGRPAMQTPFFYLILADYLNTCEKKPKAVVLNISFYLLGGQRGYLEDIYLTHYQPKIWQVYDAIKEGLISPLEGIKWYIISRFPPLKYRKKIRSTLESFSKGDMYSPFNEFQFYQDQFNPLNLGYCSRGGQTFNHFNAGPYDYKKGVYEQEVYLRYLEKLFDLASKHGVQLIIYSFPWPKQLETEEMKEILAFYDKLLKEKGAKYNNIHFIDTQYFWDSDCFSDQQHLNQKGANALAKEVSTWLTRYL